MTRVAQRLMTPLMAIALIAACRSAHAAPVSDAAIVAPFRQANELYRGGRFEDAAEAYRAILSRGVESGALYYNFGNALAKAGHVGQALWAYLEAERLAPRDPDVQANLAYIIGELRPEAQAGVEALLRQRRLAGLGLRLTTEELTIAWLVLLWAAALTWIAVGFSAQASARLRPIAIALSVAAVLAGAGMAARRLLLDGIPRAVVVADQAEAKFAPQDSSTTHFVVPEGSVIRRMEEELGWVQVRRPDGQSGWVRRDAVKAL